MSEIGETSRFMDALIFRSLRGETLPAEEAKVREWRRAALDHEAHYREIERLMALTADAFDDTLAEVGPPPFGASLVRRAEVPAGPASDERAPGRKAYRGTGAWRRAGLLVAGLAASLAIVLGVSVSRTPPETPDRALGADEFVTGLNDVATVQLRDGTIVRLAPQSRLSLTGRGEAREVTLDGRAYFAVAPMDSSPFTVRGQGAMAMALGTRFDVEARDNELRLLVMEGRVRLSAAGRRVDVEAGEMARAFRGALSAPIQVTDPDLLLQWTKHFLVFQSTPIREVAAEIERYFGLPVHVTGPDLDHQTITAWFADASVDDVIGVVCKVLAATCHIRTDGAAIHVSESNSIGRSVP